MALLSPSKKLASNIIFFLFLVFISISVFFTFLFQNSTNHQLNLSQELKLFQADEIKNISKIIIKNKEGEFTIEKSLSGEFTPWKMISPRDIIANSSFVEKLLNGLESSKIKKIYPDDKVNNSNFSLENPNAILTLLDQKNVQTQISIGLSNTIDNSIYLKFSNRKGIFHVEALGITLENSTLIDLIESKIIDINMVNLAEIKLYNGKKIGNPIFEFHKKENIWESSIAKSIDEKKLNEYLSELSELKSSFIVEKPTDDQKKFIANLFKKVELTLVLVDNKSNHIDYYISSTLRSFPNLDLKNESYFAMAINNNQNIYLVKKDFYKFFEKKGDEFELIAPKK